MLSFGVTVTAMSMLRDPVAMCRCAHTADHSIMITEKSRVSGDRHFRQSSVDGAPTM